MNKDLGINELTKCSENRIDRVDGRNVCARPNGFEVDEWVIKLLLVVFVVIVPRSDAGRGVEIIGTDDPDAGIVDDVVIRLLPLLLGLLLGLSLGIVNTEGGNDEKLNVVAFGLLSEFEYEHDNGWANSTCACCSCAIRAILLPVVDICSKILLRRLWTNNMFFDEIY